MRAAVVQRIGRLPQPGEVPEPKRKADEALVAVHAGPLNSIEPLRTHQGTILARRPG